VWSERNRVEGSAVFEKRPLVVRATIDVVENNSRYTASSQVTQIRDIHGSRKAARR
jgi:hypothetical protein